MRWNHLARPMLAVIFAALAVSIAMDGALSLNSYRLLSLRWSHDGTGGTSWKSLELARAWGGISIRWHHNIDRMPSISPDLRAMIEMVDGPPAQRKWWIPTVYLQKNPIAFSFMPTFKKALTFDYDVYADVDHAEQSGKHVADIRYRHATFEFPHWLAALLCSALSWWLLRPLFKNYRQVARREKGERKNGDTASYRSSLLVVFDGRQGSDNGTGTIG